MLPDDLANKILDVSNNYSIELQISSINRQIVSKMVSETSHNLTELLNGLIQTRKLVT